MSYGSAVALDRPSALVADEVQAALRETLGEETGPYVMLGACDPPLAHEALSADSSIGLLQPCDVVVREREGRTAVEALDPNVMVQVSGNPRLAAVTDDAAHRLNAALASLAGAPNRPGSHSWNSPGLPTRALDHRRHQRAAGLVTEHTPGGI